MWMEIVWDAFIDGVKVLPFLLAAFLILELVEHYSGDYVNRRLAKVGRAGPFVGALAGCFPQCGFSVVAANFFAGGIISAGTMIAVFLATSDEAILILLSNPGRGTDILWLLLVKVVIAMLAGSVLDFLAHRKTLSGDKPKHWHEQQGAHHHNGIIRAALWHTLQIFIYLFLFTVLLNFLIEVLGIEKISAFLLGNSVFQPALAALIGLIPNCAASVILAELYLNGAISFAAVVAGLCSGAGVGLVVLFKMNKNLKENFKIVGLLYGISVLAGIVLELLLR